MDAAESWEVDELDVEKMDGFTRAPWMGARWRPMIPVRVNPEFGAAGERLSLPVRKRKDMKAHMAKMFRWTCIPKTFRSQCG